ncbi:MAG: NTP transferase domain-containing protein [Candidatus Omnitrophica bacterium]|nr:NTP transferase domain-containing protein [Candidatus Omnitrophota bacterium]
MTAILLAAGVGKRMGEDAVPKCLLSVGGKTLLRRTLEDLRSVGVSDVVLVVGFRKELLEAEARKHAGSLRLHVVENPRYREGAILSLWSARRFLDQEALIMDADVLCPPAVFERMLLSPHANCFLVDDSSEDSGEEQMVFGRGDRAFHIAKRAPAEVQKELSRFGESIGFLKLSTEAARELRSLLEWKVGSGTVGIEHEQVYPELMKKVIVGVERMRGLPWAEIDTPEDLKRAQEEILPRMQAPQCLNRRIAGFFLPWVLRLPLSANQWTFVSLLLGLASVFYIADGGYSKGVWGALLFQLFYLADDWDGAVARAKGQSSVIGGWLDVSVDAVVQTALVVALTAGLLRQEGAPGWVRPLGAVAAAGMMLDFVVTLRAKACGVGPGVFGDLSRNAGEGFSTRLPGWLRRNLSHENFSLVLAAALALDQRQPLLAGMAVGCHAYWIHFLRDTMER